MRPCLFLVALVALAGLARAAPPDGRDVDEIVRRREEMKSEYEEVRAQRLQALRRAAAETAGGTDAIPGWRDGAVRRTGPGASAAPPPGTPAAEPPEAGPLVGKRQLPLLLVGGGVLLALVLRLFLPWIFEIRLFGRRGRPVPAGERSAQTVRLKPRSERRLGDG